MKNSMLGALNSLELLPWAWGREMRRMVTRNKGDGKGFDENMKDVKGKTLYDVARMLAKLIMLDQEESRCERLNTNEGRVASWNRRRSMWSPPVAWVLVVTGDVEPWDVVVLDGDAELKVRPETLVIPVFGSAIEAAVRKLAQALPTSKSAAGHAGCVLRPKEAKTLAELDPFLWWADGHGNMTRNYDGLNRLMFCDETGKYMNKQLWLETMYARAPALTADASETRKSEHAAALELLKARLGMATAGTPHPFTAMEGALQPKDGVITGWDAAKRDDSVDAYTLTAAAMQADGRIVRADGKVRQVGKSAVLGAPYGDEKLQRLMQAYGAGPEAFKHLGAGLETFKHLGARLETFKHLDPNRYSERKSERDARILGSGAELIIIDEAHKIKTDYTKLEAHAAAAFQSQYHQTPNKETDMNFKSEQVSKSLLQSVKFTATSQGGNAGLAALKSLTLKLLPIKWGFWARITGKHKKVAEHPLTTLAVATGLNIIAQHALKPNNPTLVATQALQDAAMAEAMASFGEAKNVVTALLSPETTEQEAE